MASASCAAFAAAALRLFGEIGGFLGGLCLILTAGEFFFGCFDEGIGERQFGPFRRFGGEIGAFAIEIIAASGENGVTRGELGDFFLQRFLERRFGGDGGFDQLGQGYVELFDFGADGW